MNSASHSSGLPNPLPHSQPALDGPAVTMAKVSWVAGEVPAYCSLDVAVQDTSQGRRDSRACIGIGPPWTSLRRVMPSLRVGRNGLDLNQLSEDPRGIMKEPELLWMLGGLEIPKGIPQSGL